MSNIVRPAAKAILFVPNGEVVLAAGSRGMLNLPGGGIDWDNGETPQEAVLRELEEEIGVTVDDIDGPLRLMGEVEGPVRSSDGFGYTACWEVFRGTLRPDAELLPANEITAIQTRRPEAIVHMGYPYMSDLGACAVRKFGLLNAKPVLAIIS